ncbi:Sphingosine N-acyltransferase lag1 [Lecanosticta acicola]|uniref:Sphingosine N-acyltransferase lag1 n=1 Tax=Lecanosticta acicola TaxID=111012 RepID=A0AAI8YUD2_9PEZI|nr:Sphingosine N-acyltransferase lag1 [Lecanosticta acicola]
MAPQLKAGAPNLSPPSPQLGSNTPPPRPESNVDDLAVCASSGDFVTPKRRNMRNSKDHESIGSALRKMVMQHQLGLPLNFIVLLAMSHMLFPSLRDRTRACFILSYPTAVEGQYSQGPLDLYLVGSCIVYFTAFRAFMLDYVLLPLAGKCGIGKRKGKVRFAEQAYLLTYYTIFWSWGVYVFWQDTPSDAKNLKDVLASMWTEYPRLTIPTGIKLYYLSQLAFWIQQILVIHLEERRKDHYQMLMHHFVTVGLMMSSYSCRLWRVGNAILVLMDIVDLVFPLAKIFRYVGWQTACDAMFGVFVITWISARHVGYLAVCWSIYEHINGVNMRYGTFSLATGKLISTDGGNEVFANVFQPILRPDAKTVGLNAYMKYGFLGLLLSLQIITLVWLVMILRVVVRVLRGQGADDTRSDDEGGEEAEDEVPGPIPAQADAEKPRFIEVETSSDEVTWPTRNARHSSSNMGRRKAKGISSGLNLGEHKEILNRIGCLSEEQLAREREKREGSTTPQPPNDAKR